MIDYHPVTDAEAAEWVAALQDDTLSPTVKSSLLLANNVVERLLADRKQDKERILDLEDTVKSLINQYAYEQTRDGVPVLWAGHQRTLEYAYDVMGYPNPVPVEVIRGKAAP